MLIKGHKTISISIFSRLVFVVLVIDLEKKSDGTYDLFAITAATISKESTFVEKLQDKSEFSYTQTATIIIQVFL